MLELARAVAEHCEVTRGGARARATPATRRSSCSRRGLADFDTLLEAVKRHDVVVAQRLPPQLLRYVARLPVRFVADLYNPQMIEVLEAAGDGPSTVAAAGLALDARASARWPTW